MAGPRTPGSPDRPSPVFGPHARQAMATAMGAGTREAGEGAGLPLTCGARLSAPFLFYLFLWIIIYFSWKIWKFVEK